MGLDDSEHTFDDVETLLEADLEDFSYEMSELYTRIERYAETAEVMDSAGREEDAEYFRELATDTYDSFVTAIQLKKTEEDEYDVDL